MEDTTPTTNADPPLPPALYWSATLANRLNLMFAGHPLHGLIDTTGPIYMACVDDSWEVLRDNDLPTDARRLVCER